MQSFLEGIYMKDNTINYSKILEALNRSLNLVDGASEANEAVIEQLSSAQQSVQQAMSHSLTRDIGM